MRNKKLISIIMFVSILLLTFNFNSYGLFRSVFIWEGSVKAADYKDIIKDIEFCNDDYSTPRYNPKKIVIKKADDINYNPVIYFTVTGELSDYILNINSVRLDSEEVEVPIRLNVNLQQFLTLLSGESCKIDGEIHIKYLNEYIDQDYSIRFSRNYLVNKFIDSLGITQISRVSDSSRQESLNEIKDKIETFLPQEELSTSNTNNQPNTNSQPTQTSEDNAIQQEQDATDSNEQVEEDSEDNTEESQNNSQETTDTINEMNDSENDSNDDQSQDKTTQQDQNSNNNDEDEQGS